MFGKAKKQKVDQKTLLVAFDAAMDASEAQSPEKLLEETGKTRQELLDAVMADDEVISCAEDLQGAINAEPWRLWGADVDEDVINHLIKMVRHLYADFNSLALLTRFNGHGIAEYVFKLEPDGFLTLDRLLSKDGELDRYELRRDGTVLLNQEDGAVELNQDIKFLVLKNKAVPARPAGELMIIRAYPAVAMRSRQWAYARQFIARYAQPYVVGKQQNSVGAVQDFTSKIFSFINGGAMGLGSDDSIEMHQLNGDGSAFELIERMANRRIQKLLLGRVKTSELTAGSRSAQETDDAARQDRISSYLSLMTRGIQHAIDAVIAVNQYYGKPINAPQGIWFEYQKQTKPDLNRAQVDKIYVEAGVLELTEEYVGEILGYEDSHFKIKAAAANPSADAQLSKPHTVKLSNDANLPNVLLDDDAGNDVDDERSLMQPKIAAILSLLSDCDSYSDFDQRLQALELPDGGMMDDLLRQCCGSYIDGLSADNRASD